MEGSRSGLLGSHSERSRTTPRTTSIARASAYCRGDYPPALEDADALPRAGAEQRRSLRACAATSTASEEPAQGDRRLQPRDRTEASTPRPLYNSRAAAHAALGEIRRGHRRLHARNQAAAGRSGADPERGDVYDALGRYRDAIDDYDQSISLKADNPDAFLGRGFSWGQDGRIPARHPGLRSGRSTLRPEDAKAYTLRGAAYFRLDENDKAVADFTAAMKITPRGRVSLPGARGGAGEAGAQAEALSGPRTGREAGAQLGRGVSGARRLVSPTRRARKGPGGSHARRSNWTRSFPKLGSRAAAPTTCWADYAKAQATWQQAVRLRPDYKEAADVFEKAEAKSGGSQAAWSQARATSRPRRRPAEAPRRARRSRPSLPRAARRRFQPQSRHGAAQPQPGISAEEHETSRPRCSLNRANTRRRSPS